jgi:hypothetical protein
MHILLGKKFYSVIAISFAARTCELLPLQFYHAQLITIGDRGGRGFRISYKRGKRNSSYTKDEEFANVYGELEV